MKTMALRRFNSRQIGAKTGSPGYLSRTLLKMPMPSACSVSKAYSISRNVPSVSAIGMAANSPKRPGWSTIILVMKSFTPRATVRDFSVPS